MRYVTLLLRLVRELYCLTTKDRSSFVLNKITPERILVDRTVYIYILCRAVFPAGGYNKEPKHFAEDCIYVM
jgi:hypothetical protein